jgi:hypothetical protein
MLKIGSIVVVQTHGRSGHYNPHLHIIKTSGGVSTEHERWHDLGYFNKEQRNKIDSTEGYQRFIKPYRSFMYGKFG